MMDEQNISPELEDSVDCGDTSLAKGEPAGTEKVKNTPMQEIYDWLEVFIVAVAAVILIFTFWFRIATVDGDSMLPTLTNGERLVVMEAFYEPKQGDIIVCQSQKYGMSKPLVKRVIATSGQTIKIDFDTWTVWVDGVKLEEDYVNYIAGASMHGWIHGSSYTVPSGYVFVMGDNRNNSQDSRSSSVGPIDQRLILGKGVIGLSDRDGLRFFE